MELRAQMEMVMHLLTSGMILATGSRWAKMDVLMEMV
jgi:hypothetical protein